MEIRFFKYNLTRQILLYPLILLFALLIYAEWDSGSTTGVIIFASIEVGLILSIIYQYFSFIKVNEVGITYHSLLREYCLAWNEIGQIKIVLRWNIKVFWIIVLKSKNPRDRRKKINAYNRKGHCITCTYSAEMASAIHEYGGEAFSDFIEKQFS